MHLSELGLNGEDISALEKKHIYTDDDLLHRFPRLYRDYRNVLCIQDCINGEYHAVYAHVNDTEIRQGTTKMYLRVNMVSNGQRMRADFFVGSNSSRKSRNYAKYLMYQVYGPFSGKDVVVTGKISIDPVFGISVNNAEFTEVEKFVPGIKPIYPKNGDMPLDRFCFWLRRIMEMQGEILEGWIRKRYGLMSYRDALCSIHFPKTMEDIDSAQKQFAFYDLFWFELKRKELESGRPPETGVCFRNRTLMETFINSLPFPLTKASEEELSSGETGQADVLERLIRMSMAGRRAEAVIEGDVGCGKTAVAAAMAILAAGNGYQTVIMAPKTVLASQHAEEIGGWCARAGVTCEIMIGTPKNAKERKERAQSLKRIAEGTAQVIVGTHSCFTKEAEYKNVGLVIIDEEQQFGVEQKAALRGKALPDAHYIEMSATPVPRSLALSIYGDKEILRITKKPGGRKPIQTGICSTDAPAFRWMEKQLAQGKQCYVVVPMIEENEEEGIDGVKKTAKKYESHFGSLGYKVVSADGKMKEDKFRKAVDDFKANRAQILVATTVIEVGVNVPNATVIVIENAERFGLSQLHQLRGRVGRGKDSSYCILITKDKDNERIRTMEETSDGFIIAEKDLLLRGPGDVNGLRQSGQNKYIAEALVYPDIHKMAIDAARFCDGSNMMGAFLRAKYEEHDRYEEERNSTGKNE